MPLYSMSRAHAHEQIAAAEARGERVTLIVPDGAILLVVTESPRRPNVTLETR